MSDQIEPRTIATLLVGAEGAWEVDDQPWARKATEEERLAFIVGRCKGDEKLYERWLIDGAGRPYWLLTILDSAPEEIQALAKRLTRCIRLTK